MSALSATVASMVSSSSAGVRRRRAESALKRAIESSQVATERAPQIGQPAATHRRTHRSGGPPPRSRCRRTGRASDRPGCDAGRTVPAWRACRPPRCVQPTFHRRNIHQPWLQSQASRRRPIPAGWTSETLISPTSRPAKTRRTDNDLRVHYWLFLATC